MVDLKALLKEAEGLSQQPHISNIFGIINKIARALNERFPDECSQPMSEVGILQTTGACSDSVDANVKARPRPKKRPSRAKAKARSSRSRSKRR